MRTPLLMSALLLLVGSPALANSGQGYYTATYGGSGGYDGPSYTGGSGGYDGPSYTGGSGGYDGPSYTGGSGTYDGPSYGGSGTYDGPSYTGTDTDPPTQPTTGTTVDTDIEYSTTTATGDTGGKDEPGCDCSSSGAAGSWAGIAIALGLLARRRSGSS